MTVPRGKARRWTWTRLSLREMRNNPRFSALFCLNLAIGLVGFIAVDTFKDSVTRGMDARSRTILGADLGITSNRVLTEDEEKKVADALPSGAETARDTSFYSMVRAGEASRLVEIRGIDEAFPLYGELKLDGRVVDAAHPPRLAGTNDVWIYPELLLQLGVKVGDEVQVGDAKLRVADVVRADPATSSVSFTIAPRLYLSRAQLEATGLLGKGSRTFHSILVKVPPTSTLEDVEPRLKKALRSSREVRIRSHTAATEEMGRLVTSLNDYLGLVALVALFFANVGSVYLFRSFITRRAREIAILLSLGATPREARSVYVQQLIGLGVLAALTTLAITAVTLPLLPKILGPFLSDGIAISISPRSLGVAVIAGVGGSILFCLPVLARFRGLKPSALFQETVQPRLEGGIAPLLAYLPGVVVYWGLAVWQAKSLFVGSLFVGGFLAAGFVLGLVGFALVRFVFPRVRQAFRGTGLGAWSRRLAFVNLSRERVSTLSCFLALALAALLVNLIPQVRHVIEGEILKPDSEKLPSLFLFDIQDDQVQGIESFLEESAKTRLLNPSPMVRARLMAVNGQAVGPATAPEPAETTRSGEDGEDGDKEESQRDGFTRRRMFNLSARPGLSDSEVLVEGRPFTPGGFADDGKELPEISLEMRFAERMELALGDVLEFDIQGVSISGKVVNLRRVRWATFQPNFFVQFQPGVLDDAPKTWVAAAPGLPPERRAVLQTEIVKRFPNVSIVDVTSTVTRILGVIDQMSRAITAMAYLSLAAGLAVLYAIANHQAARRRRETALLKALGARFSDITRTSLWEFGTLGLAAGVLGGVISLGVSYGVSRFIFEAPWAFDHRSLLAGIVGVGGLAVATGWVAVRASLRTKPAELLNGAANL